MGEKGDWMPDILLQDCLMERMGIVEEDYVNLLNQEEYQHWEARMQILHCITFGETERAEALLGAYEETCDINKPLERQFYLAMKAQVRRSRGGSGEELSALFEEAAGMTVPREAWGKLSKLALSVKELNLLLEAEKYRREGERPQRYREVADYIEGSEMENIARVRIYPKAVYFMCRCMLQNRREDAEWDGEALLGYCRRAVALLRQNKRMYYLWEILDLMGKLAALTAEKMRGRGQGEKVQALEVLYQEQAEWKNALVELYREWKVPRETTDFCYLYVMKNVYCVNDVIRIRRNMFGLSQKELCSGICSVKTLRRLEQGSTNPHRKTAAQLLERLGIPGEFTRTELVTERPEAWRLMEQLHDSMNKGEWEAADRLRVYIQKMVSMEIPLNRQTLMREALLIRWRKGELAAEEYCTRMQEVLELTLPCHTVLQEGKKFLTGEEQSCILNWMQGMDGNSEKYLLWTRRLEEIYQPYIEAGLWEGIWNRYELVAEHVGGACGDRGDYDRADWYRGFILRGCLYFRRMGSIHHSLYDRWRNNDMQKRRCILPDRTLDEEEELSKCILFSILAEDRRSEDFYRRKLEAIRKR